MDGARAAAMGKHRLRGGLASAWDHGELWSCIRVGPTLRQVSWPGLPCASSGPGRMLPWVRMGWVGMLLGEAAPLGLLWVGDGSALLAASTQSSRGRVSWPRKGGLVGEQTMSIIISGLPKRTQIISTNYALNLNLLIPNLVPFQ